ncbi:hypothetical protein N9A86_03790 [Akkermansiaceae bacterium]|nr:hypothetical protein [Akkermansiaceae bacterium]
MIAADERSLPKIQHMVCTHIHLYNSSHKEGIRWSPKYDKVLYKPNLRAEFHLVTTPSGLTRIIIVESSEAISEKTPPRPIDWRGNRQSAPYG